MTKEELERYAVDNRARLESQSVMMGDVVKILRGELAGENGVVVGIIALDKNDYTDPYFEVEMNCEVPDKYKCRKDTLNPRNIVGGLTACDFEVIGNRAPEKENIHKGKTITIPVKTDFGEDVGVALLDRALELQKKYTELEREIVRLFDFMNATSNGQHLFALKFSNDMLGTIANSICTDFRPLTEEEKKQMFRDIETLKAKE